MTDPIELVQGVYRALADRDIAACLAALDPAVVIRQAEALPWGGTHEGAASVPEFLGTLYGHIDSQVTIDRMFLAGEVVVALGVSGGTVRATGKPFRCDVVHLWTVRAGKVARFEVYLDTPAMLATLAP